MVSVLALRVVRDSLLLLTYFPRIGDVVFARQKCTSLYALFLFVSLLCGGPGFVTFNAAYIVYLYSEQRTFWSSMIPN